MTDLKPLIDIATGGLNDAGRELVKTAAAAGIKRLTRRWVAKYFDEQQPIAIEKAEANVASFLAELAQRVERLEARPGDAAGRIAGGLEDPDVAATIRSAVLGAARTTSGERHRLLAEAVAQRLAAEPGSVRAVASNLAVEVVPQLASPHLELLGLLAVIWGIRPVQLIPHHLVPHDPPDAAADAEAARPFVEAYREWIGAQLGAYSESIQNRDDSYAHLVAASCITFERQARRDIDDILLPGKSWRYERKTRFDRIIGHQLLWMQREWLGPLWEGGLQHARPTPTGLLIGCAVHDAKTGDRSALEWEWSDIGAAEDGTVDDRVWDGRRIDRRFVEAMKRELDHEELVRRSRGGR